MPLRHAFESIHCAKPSSCNCPCRIVVTSMQNSPQTQFFPTPVTRKKSIVSNQKAINAKCSWPSIPCQSVIEMFSFDNPILGWKLRLSYLLKSCANIASICVFFDSVYKFWPIISFQILFNFSPCFLDVFFSLWNSLL